MKNYFICLANSIKLGGRCIGGVEIECCGSSVRVQIKANGTPKWIRPVSHTEHGELSSCLNNIKKLDIVELEVTDECPKHSQSENVHYSSLNKVGQIDKSLPNMDILCDNFHTRIFHNRGKAVPVDVFEANDYSLMFIKPQNPIFSFNEQDHIRVAFSHNSVEYKDLSVTDPFFIDEINRNKQRLSSYNGCDNMYFTMSLGEVFNDFHYKLVAGVIAL